MDKQPPFRSQLTQAVKRYDADLPTCSPLSEDDLEIFHLFYHDFLNKSDDDALSLLKVVHMLARDDLRSFVHRFAAQRRSLGRMLKEGHYRDLLLSFPTTAKNVYELIFDYSRIYPGTSETPQRWLTEQARDFLDCTEMFRLDLDALLARVPPMLASDREFLHNQLATDTKLEGYKFLLLLLADQPFLVLLSGQATASSGMIKLEGYLKEHLGERFEEQLIEFFLIGGGFLRVEEKRVVLGGHSTYVDPTVNPPDGPRLLRFLALFCQHKFMVAKNLLEDECGAMVEVQMPNT